MTRVAVKDAIAEQRKLIRELRSASPVNAAALAVAVSRLKRWQKISKPLSAKRVARIVTVRSALETLLKPCLKSGTNPALLARVAEHVVDLCDQQGKALKARHKKPGASNDLGEAMRTAWATGKWRTRDKCAEEYGQKIGLGWHAARRHLQDT